MKSPQFFSLRFFLSRQRIFSIGMGMSVMMGQDGATNGVATFSVASRDI